MELIDGSRVVTLSVSDFFASGVETPEQLDAVLADLRRQIEKLIGEGKKVLLQ